MPKKVLIAEDQPDSRQLLQDILEHFQPYGVQVFTAVNGPEACEIARRERPDLMLLDIMMPGLSGYEVCQKLKTDPELAGIYVIVISAKAQLEDRKEAAIVGADEYLTKPYDIHTVMERIQKVLDIQPI